MYFTAFEALDPADLTTLKAVLEDSRLDRGIVAPDPHLDELARDVVNLWLAGFRGPCELRVMMKPLDITLFSNDTLDHDEHSSVAPAWSRTCQRVRSAYVAHR
ncbi:hypothetical protein [Rhizobium wenxiniae]|uniref:hypothetical protein n=1 Tax=Rhizobium wenxiniae TaxID=1737357 RepID=UPI003C1F989C